RGVARHEGVGKDDGRGSFVILSRPFDSLRSLRAGSDGEGSPAAQLEMLRCAQHDGGASIAAICGTSLSPRPLRFATTTFPRPRSLRSSQPSACDDSSAGMIPSLSLSLWNASSARSSLQSWYSTRPID